MKLEKGLKIHSDVLNKWSAGLGLPNGEYEVYQIHADYFTVIMKGWMPIPVSKHLFIEFYQSCIEAKAKFMSNAVKTAISEYGVEYLSGREIPPKGIDLGRVRTYLGYLDSHGDVLLKGAFDKDTMYKTTVNFDPKELLKTLKSSQQQVGNYADKLKLNSIQYGKTINLPRKVAAIKRGQRFTGRAITSGTRPASVTVGYFGD